jgi:hypothetical protein
LVYWFIDLIDDLPTTCEVLIAMCPISGIMHDMCLSSERIKDQTRGANSEKQAFAENAFGGPYALVPRAVAQCILANHGGFPQAKAACMLATGRGGPCIPVSAFDLFPN